MDPLLLGTIVAAGLIVFIAGSVNKNTGIIDTSNHFVNQPNNILDKGVNNPVACAGCAIMLGVMVLMLVFALYASY